MYRKRIDIGEEIKKRWFIIGILFTLLLAVLNPYVGASGGPLKAEYTVRYGAVVVIFLMSGLRLESGALSKATQKRDLMFYIQGYSFLAVPMVVWLMSTFFNIINVNTWILRGLMTVSCMPPSISSGVVLTRAAGGDEAAAVFNTALGSVLGVFLTPLMLLYTAGSTTVAPLSRSILQLVLTVLVPFSVGRLLLRPIFDLLKWDMSNQGYWVQLALLSMLYSSFCDAILEHDADLNTFDILITITLVVLILLVTSGISWFLAASILAPGDISAAVFCSTHKSLSMGLPMLRVMYGGDMGHTALLALPLLAHQPAQALLGAALAPHLQPVTRSKLYV